MSTDRVMANLLVAHNSATTLQGSSVGLSPASDRKRFHAFRTQARAIVIGGNTYRNEPYASTPIPLYVASRSLPQTSSSQLHICNDAPYTIIERALSECGAPILIEGGPKLLMPLIEKQQIDALHITRVSKEGDGNFFDDALLAGKYHLVEEVVNDEDSSRVVFQSWRPTL